MHSGNAPQITWLRSLLYLFGTIFFLGTLSVAVVAVLDREPGRSPAPAETLADPAASEINAPGSGRVFILFIDSWRYQAVTDPGIMPSVAKLRREGTFAEVEGVHDAITVPAIRAAFSGHDHFQVLGFVRNFISAAPGIESLFTQLKRRGDALSIYSDHKTFHQFGTDTAGIHSFDDEDSITAENQVKQARMVFRQFAEGHERVAIFHAVFVDYMAHATGVHHPEYASVSRMADELITDLAAGMAPNDTLIVFGDHGHDEKGRHIVGLDVPTAFLAVGPGFRKGVNLGRIHITSYRYLVGWALKLPLAKDYTAGRYPEALVAAPGPAPAGYFEQRSGKDDKHRTGRHPSWIYIGLLAGVAAAAAVWLSSRKSLYSGSGVSKGRRNVRLAAIALCSVVALAAAGVALAQLRPLVHEPDYETLRNLWAVGLAALLLMQWRLSPATTGWVGLAAPFLLLWPTTYRYGAPGAVVPAWLCWATGVVIAWFRFRNRGTGGGWRLVSALVCFLGIALFLQSFVFTEAFTFEFTNWMPLSYYLTPYSSAERAFAGAVAALVIVFQPRARWSAVLIPALFCTYVVFVFRHLTPESPIHIAMALGCLMAALVLKYRAVRNARPLPIEAVHCYIIGLFAALFYAVRLGPEMYLYALLTTAALRLSAVLVRHLPRNVHHDRSHALLLIVFGAIGSVWVTTGWGMRKLEWGFLYDFIPAGVVENYVGFFLPLIAVKLCLLAFIARAVVIDEMRTVPFPTDAAAFAAGLKIISLLAIGIGLHLAEPSTDLYVEAVQQIAFVLVLCLTFLPMPWGVRHPTDSCPAPTAGG